MLHNEALERPSPHRQIAHGAEPLVQAPVQQATDHQRILLDQRCGADENAGLLQQQAAAAGLTLAIQPIAAADRYTPIVQCRDPGPVGHARMHQARAALMAGE